ncbi:lysozyme inhibitor LprI family protein [Cellvibrio sp. PSBB023]|uniref:lysozyme inhibitor LprI family protein n=1 Tax=Cellvibrio sp. PSBB023 TaxID=1945512 RepID=UPI0009C2D48B|nr:lysozyme inhibitor LprI family protein [Cellvibrio sp. PSBB023]AQT61305.1 hypothetical protein B0D95_15210 [Cellvibrio sp. PSBB023]
MQKLHYSWLSIAALTLVLFSNLTFAIDNPDAPDLLAEFELREKPFLAAIQKPTNTTTDFSIAYANYQDFLDKELNRVYKTLRKNLPVDTQKQLKTSQVSWLKYRDLEFVFIDSTWNNIDFGSSSAISRGEYRASLLRNRVVQLMHYAKSF